tara:strand:+ start:978 stop:1439 length:462 start_codon:yes stop_codon:yes gene_type:complete
MTPDQNLKNLAISLPKANDPVGSYVATKISGNLLYISGQISIDENGNLIKGKLGKDYNTEQGYEAAKRCALSIISQAKKACTDDLSKINSCIKLTGYVNSTDEFTEQPKVINGASDLIKKVFGDSGSHTRAAVSANSLPLGVAVEVDAIFDLK